MESLVQIGLSNAVVALVLAAVAALLGAVLRKPALTHGLWLLVLLKLVTPPLVLIPIGWSEPARSPEVEVTLRGSDAEPAEGDGAEPVVVWLSAEELAALQGDQLAAAPAPRVELPPEPAPAPAWGWWQLAGWVWLAGTLAWFGLALVRVITFHRLLRFARPAPEWLRRQVAALAGKLGLKQVPPIYLVPGRIPPMIWTALLGPRLLLPAGLWESLSVPRRETLLVHELAHLRRRDHWVRGLELVVLGLYWWHPIVWVTCRQLREAEEQCCDAWVVSTLNGSARTYAEAILETLDYLAEDRTPAPLLASGVGLVSDLKRRLTMIMQGTTPRSLTWRGVVTVLLVAGLLLPALPVWAQPGAQDPAAALKELREKLAELEKKLAGPNDPQPKSDPKIAADALKKAEAELKEAQAALHKKMEEVQALSAKVAEAQAKVVKAGGKVDRAIQLWGYRAGEGQQGFPVFPGQLGDQPRYRIEVRPDPNTPATPAVREVPKVPAPPALPAGPADKRIENLEQKLERLLQELQELRKSINPQPGRGTNPGGFPGGRPPAAGVRYDAAEVADVLRAVLKPNPAPVPAPEKPR
jgi:beta-lactamase regulating signal transducer with metallopeptidase domain